MEYPRDSRVARLNELCRTLHDGISEQKEKWTPVISPSSMIFYEGDEFKEWKGNALIGSLSAKGVVRVKFNGDRAEEIERFEMETRIRAIGESTDGAIWLLEDGRPIRKEKSYAQGGGRLLKLTAVK